MIKIRLYLDLSVLAAMLVDQTPPPTPMVQPPNVLFLPKLSVYFWLLYAQHRTYYAKVGWKKSCNANETREQLTYLPQYSKSVSSTWGKPFITTVYYHLILNVELKKYIDRFYKWRLLHVNEARMLFNQNGRRQGSVSAWFCLTFCPSSYLKCLENYRESKLKVFMSFRTSLWLSYDKAT